MGQKLYCVSYILYIHMNIKDCRSMLGNNSCNVLSLRSSLHKPHFTHYHTLMWKTEKRTKELKRVVPKPGHGPLQPRFRIMEIAKAANLLSAPGNRKNSSSSSPSFISLWFMRDKGKSGPSNNILHWRRFISQKMYRLTERQETKAH